MCRLISRALTSRSSALLFADYSFLLLIISAFAPYSLLEVTTSFQQLKHLHIRIGTSIYGEPQLIS